MSDARGTQGGPWAVLDYDGVPLDGRWTTEALAVEEGLAGRYLFSGHEVVDTRLCNRQMRDGRCALDADHRGRCTTVAFSCDCCGKRRRSRPASVATNPWDGEVEAEVCFMCTRVLA